MTKWEIAENASGAMMERGGGVKCSRQVNVTRERSVTSCFAVFANKFDEGDRINLTREIAPVNDVGRGRLFADALPHMIILTLCDSTIVDHWLAAWVGCWKPR